MNNKKIIVISLATLLLLGDIFFLNEDNKNTPIANIIQPIEDNSMSKYIPNEEFNNFNIYNIMESTTEIKIKSHNNDQTFVTISNDEDISKLVSLVQHTKSTEISSETHEKIAMAQGEGNSITLSFTLSDGTISSTRVLLNLNIISINDTYCEVSSELTNLLQKKLKEVPNFKDLNKPIPGF